MHGSMGPLTYCLMVCLSVMAVNSFYLYPQRRLLSVDLDNNQDSVRHTPAKRALFRRYGASPAVIDLDAQLAPKNSNVDGEKVALFGRMTRMTRDKIFRRIGLNPYLRFMAEEAIALKALKEAETEAALNRIRSLDALDTPEAPEFLG